MDYPNTSPPSLTNSPFSTSHAGLLHHPIYIFIGQLSPSLPSLSGSRALSNRGNLSHSLIERLLGDYGEVRNKVVLRNHKHKSFLSLCWGILFSPAAVYHCGSFFFLPLSVGAHLSAINTYYQQGKGNGQTDIFRWVELALHVLFTFLFNHSWLWCVMMLKCNHETRKPHTNTHWC